MIKKWRMSRWFFIFIGTILVALSFADALSQWLYVSNPSTSVDAIEIRLFQSAADALAATDHHSWALAVAAAWSITALVVSGSIFRIGVLSENAKDLPSLVLERLNQLSRLLAFAVAVRAACGGVLVWLGKDADIEVAVNFVADEFIWSLLVFVSIERMTRLLMDSDCFRNIDTPQLE